MYLDYTHEELLAKFSDMSTRELIVLLLKEGLELKPDPETEVGLYRRESGHDLAYYGYGGEWKTFDLEKGLGSTDLPVWACFDTADWWVLILDQNNSPVKNGTRILFDRDGSRLG